MASNKTKISKIKIIKNKVIAKIISPDIILLEDVLSEDEVTALISSYHGKKVEMDMSKNSYYEDLSARPEVGFMDMTKDQETFLNNKCQDIINKMVDIYGNVGVINRSPFRYNEYSTGRGYKYHVDRSNKAPHLRDREISLIFALNDDYSGGLLNFPRQGVQVKIPKFGAIAFPSNYTHPHEVQPVTEGVRKTIVTWLT